MVYGLFDVEGGGRNVKQNLGGREKGASSQAFEALEKEGR